MSNNAISESGAMQLCSFRLADRLFGVNIKDIKEVCAEIDITPIYHADDTICGYMNIRGQIHLVVDLRTTFGFESCDITPESKVVIFKQSVDEPFGILVDSIGDVVTIKDTDITDRRTGEEGEVTIDEQIREQRRAPVSLCDGICQLKEELMLLLNARLILPQFKNTK